MNNQDIIDQLDPDRVKCYRCHKYWDKKDTREIDVKDYHKVYECWECYRRDVDLENQTKQKILEDYCNKRKQ